VADFREKDSLLVKLLVKLGVEPVFANLSVATTLYPTQLPSKERLQLTLFQAFSTGGSPTNLSG